MSALKHLLFGGLALAVVCAAAPVHAQGQPGTVESGSILRSRKATPTPKPAEKKPEQDKAKQAAPAKKPQAQSGAVSPRTNANNRPTTGTAGRPGQPQGRQAAAKAGGSPTTTGQVKQVTPGLLDSVRPQRVVMYDEAELAARPGVIILNERRFETEKSLIERDGSRETLEPIARPL